MWPRNGQKPFHGLPLRAANVSARWAAGPPPCAQSWGDLIWDSESPDRMASILKSWETHCAHPHLPRSLAARLVSAGFRFHELAVFPILNLQWDDDRYSKGLAGLIRDFVGRKNEIPADDLRRWYEEFGLLSEAGRYFFSSNRYIFMASKPGG